jgi:gliding motility-associated-like protein
MKKVFYILTFFFSVSYTQAQIVGDCNAPYDIPSALVELIVGEGIQYSNVTYSGFDCSSGFFSGTSNIGLDSGLVLATNSLSSISGGFSIGSGSGVDVDLSQLLTNVGASTTTLKNVLILEFDFVPSADTMTFDYVYASNEYPTSTCSSTSDVFGFFVSGPGISGSYSNGAENIALVPDPTDLNNFTNTPVLINTVNSGLATSGTSAPCDVIDPSWQDYSIFYVDNTPEATVAFPGFTVPLTAMAEVTPCASYHMKIAIADVQNSQLPSALFIKENSFSTSPSVDIQVESNVTDYFSTTSEYYNNIYEGCGDAVITFYRPPMVTGDINILYHLGGDAIQGLDYILTSNFSGGGILMPAADSQLEMTITSFNDWIDEGEESIYFEIDAMDYGCFQSAPDTIEFSLLEQPELTLTLTDDFSSYCPGDDAVLEAQLSGGVGGLMASPSIVEPYYYEWSQIGTASTQLENPLETTMYCVEATDVCGTQILESCVEVFVHQYPELEADSQVKYICDDITTQLCVLNVEGGEGNYNYLWSNGDTDSCIVDYHDVYTVYVSDGCNEQVEIESEIYLDEAPDPFFEYLMIPHQNLGIEFNNYTSLMNGLAYDWSFGDGIHSSVQNPLHTYSESGLYEVTLEVTTAIAGCIKEFSDYVTVDPLYHFYAPNAFTPNNDNRNDYFRPFVTGTSSYELFVFDKGGMIVFNTTDPLSEWDGTYSGRPAAAGTYVYKVVMSKLEDIVIFEEYGSVNLIR